MYGILKKKKKELQVIPVLWNPIYNLISFVTFETSQL